MSEERKKSHVWPWIVALLIGLPVLYILSGAPAEILVAKMGEPDWLVVPGRAFYAPLGWLLDQSPDGISEWYRGTYGHWWIAILGAP